MVPVNPYAFPPSFEGSPWSYGFALFSLTMICAMSTAMLMQFVFEWHRREPLERLFPNRVHDAVSWGSPLTVHRFIISGFLLTFLLGALPDVLVLFAWGEATIGTMETLFAIDRYCDGAAIVPFLSAVVLSAWGMQVIPQQLVRGTRVALRRPRWETVKGHVKIAAIVLVIAIGVTLAKASA